MKHLYKKTLPLNVATSWATEEGVTFAASGKQMAITIEQYEALLNKAYQEGMEAAARVCDRRYMGDNNREDMEARRCAASIRTFMAE